MKKRSEKRKPRWGYWIAIAAIVVAGALLMLALETQGSNVPFVQSDTMTVFLVLLCMLPVLLFVLGFYALFSRKKGQGSATKIKIVGAPASEKEEPREEPQTADSPKEKTKDSHPRFDGLLRIDAQRAQLMGLEYDEEVTLSELCERFREYAAGKLKLYYSEEDIRRFVAGLAVSHIMILQGMSGTGKTSLAYAFGEFIGNSSTIVPVQPMWKERTDLIGYYNEFTKRFNETDLLKKMYEANYSKGMYITVLDEMNIARVEYYFAEFLSLLELPKEESRELTVVSDRWENDPKQLHEGHIKLPPNMWFVGTANNDDSTFAISDKVYDRAMVMDLDKKAENFEAKTQKRVKISAERFVKLSEEAEREYALTKRNLRRLLKLDEYMKEVFHITFGNRIMKQIRKYVPVYVACGGKEIDALDDILSKKVMRKLGMQNPVYMRSCAENLCGYLDELFGTDGMPECKAVIRRLAQNA